MSTPRSSRLGPPVAVVAVVLALAGAWGQQAESIQTNADGRAKVNWTRGLITVTGWGPRQEKLPKPLQVAAQRRVAVADAYRLLLETVHGVHVTSETTIERFELVSDTVKAKVEGLIQGFKIVSEGWQDDTKDIYMVTVGLALTPQPGYDTSLAEVLIPAIPLLEQRAIEVTRNPPAPGAPLPPPQPEPDLATKLALITRSVDVPAPAPTPLTPLPERKPGPYTGLVIDATGFELVRCMCPKIYRKDGTEVWGTVKAATAEVQKNGIAGFLPNLALALSPEAASRVGANPLVVRAIGRQGTTFCNAVVSDEEAALILAENGKSKFADQFKVIFVIGK